MSQITDFKELQDWYEKEEVTFAFSSRENKRLTCSLKGTFRVRVSGKIKYQGTQPFSAFEAYNNITEKYIKPTYKI